MTIEFGPHDDREVAIVGGCGRAGLPLGIVLASAGFRVVLVDLDAAAVARVQAGEMPFLEEGVDGILRSVLSNGRLVATCDPTAARNAHAVVVVVGTGPGPASAAFMNTIEHLALQMQPGQLLVLRSTIEPGTTRAVERILQGTGLDVDLAFCPERLAEGRAVDELASLPQIVAGATPVATKRAAALFGRVAPEVIEITPEEAEMAKLMANGWRYLTFAIANEFFRVANDRGLDYERIRTAITSGYPRGEGLPSAGFAAGPCLAKDTTVLRDLLSPSSALCGAGIESNEGLPAYVVERFAAEFPVEGRFVGILGMAFKRGSDDTRASLSYRLRDLLEERGAIVLCADPYVQQPHIEPLEVVLRKSEALFIGAPHEQYRELRPEVPVVDVWGLLAAGVRS